MHQNSVKVMPQPLIAVRDVRASTRWYEQVLGCQSLGASDHDDVYQRLYSGRELVMQLHSWDDENHPNLVDRERAPLSHGVVLWFEVVDFDERLEMIRAIQAEVLVEPFHNQYAGHREVWIRDPDGYVIGLASPGRKP